MNTKKTPPTGQKISKRDKNDKKQKNSQPMEHSKLQKLFEDELKDIYWAEKALTKAIPKMIKKTSSTELSTALENHLEETLTHVSRLEQVFESIGKKAQAKKCEAMAGLIKEAEEIMQDCDEGPMRDAGIISAGQKVEHYEIASYGILKTFARLLGHSEAAEMLEATLSEEKAADDKLTEVAESSINVAAAAEMEEA
jgi:ferritin-like metal-binding protein YciE